MICKKNANIFYPKEKWCKSKAEVSRKPPLLFFLRVAQSNKGKGQEKACKIIARKKGDGFHFDKVMQSSRKSTQISRIIEKTARKIKRNARIIEITARRNFLIARRCSVSARLVLTSARLDFGSARLDFASTGSA